MIKRMWLVLALLLGVLGMFSAVPAGADIPLATVQVDQYWTWNRGGPGSPNFWIEEINLINAAQPVWNPVDEKTGRELGFATLWLDNIEIPGQSKNIWVEVKFHSSPTPIPALWVEDPNGEMYAPWQSWISTNGQFTTWQWQLDWQPEWEYIQFNSTDYYYFGGDIELVEVATQCVPEPMSIMLGALGLGAVGGLRKLRKK